MQKYYLAVYDDNNGVEVIMNIAFADGFGFQIWLFSKDGGGQMDLSTLQSVFEIGETIGVGNWSTGKSCTGYGEKLYKGSK